MRDVRALVVGVARYAIGWPDADSAARNAYLMIRLLLMAGVAPSKISAFVDQEGLSDHQKRTLADNAIACKAPLASDIDGFWRSELPTLILPDEKMFTYWSGHGMTDAQGRRLFFCRDYSSTAVNRVFNANEFLSQLKSTIYQRQQMFFADVCGTYSNALTVATDSKPDPANLCEGDYLSVYASADGAYATSADYGSFTQMLVPVLEKFWPSWPTSDEFLAELDRAAERSDQKPFWMQTSGRHRQTDEQRIGKVSSFGAAIAKLLGDFAIAVPTLERCYHRTAQNLGVRPERRARSLVSIVDALANIPDDDSSGIPSAVLEYIKRLSLERAIDGDCKRILERWIEDNATNQRRKEIEALVEDDDDYVHLLIDISNNSQGRATNAVADLVNAQGWPIAAFEQRRLDVTSEDELLKWIAVLVDLVLEIDDTVCPQVHIFVEPPLLHVPFHKETLSHPSAYGLPLGQLYNCILHYRSRARGELGGQNKTWKEWADSLVGMDAKTMNLLEVNLLPAAFPVGTGICFTSFAHGPKTKTEAQTQRLTTLLRIRGAPYVCWSLERWDPADFPLGTRLRQLLDGALTGDFTEAIRVERTNGGVAAELSILWDDPSNRFLIQSRGVT